MEIVKQTVKINETNFDRMACDVRGEKFQKHGRLLPDSIRCLICGPSGCGKTNAVLNLLIDENGLKFQNVYVYSKSIGQPKYELLNRILGSVGGGMEYFPFSDADSIVEPNETKTNSVVVFDDLICDDQSPIREYFSRGRHAGVDCFLICQTYSKIPKQLVRDNANAIVAFKQDDLNLRHIYRDHVNTDMDFQCFKDACALCWGENRHGFISIFKDFDLDDGRYRKGFDKFIKFAKMNTPNASEIRILRPE